ncbi:MAG: orotidine-5'-phosphate decarboxylase [Armatimonadota bacterium]|nr:orotidine-5'-phosphate decarboxylase [Armatimonadota bacterium]
MAPELVVALDVPTLQEARRLAALLRPAVRWFKVGLQLFTAAGPAAVEAVRAEGGMVVLDLKVHDIPHTAAAAVRSAARLGVDALTLHLAGGPAMADAAVAAARAAGRPRLLGITRLTSEPSGSVDLSRAAAEAAVRAAGLGLDGVVAAVQEALAIRAVCPAPFLIVAAGIRPAGSDPDDQVRVATPGEAARAGCDLIVVGRPIVRALDPLRVASAIRAEMAGVSV